jgi:DNA-binding NtrC family response regulator
MESIESKRLHQIMNRCLLLDRNSQHREQLLSFCEDVGFEVFPTETLHGARELLAGDLFDVAFIELDPEDGSGIELLREPRLHAAEIIMMGSSDEPSRADEAMHAGASYFFCKPFDPFSLRQLLRDIAAENVEALNVTGHEADAPCVLDQFGFLRGSSPVMQRLYRLLRKVAVTDSALLLVGESGTGKELLAQTAHQFSPRSEGPFIAFNCASVAENLVESELFGHERGSFSGAGKRHQGFFERADGGTLLLDEITEMNLELQSRLLRVLEEKSLRRVGGELDIPVDVRIISATNRDPREAIEAGSLREDLFYRLSQFPIWLPPLRDRGDDIPGLAQYFLNELNDRHGTALEFSADALASIADYSWPGNVRQLRHFVERAYIMSESLIDLDALPEFELEYGNSRPEEGDVVIEIGTALPDAERQIILATLERHQGDKKRAARELGISLKTLYNRLNEYRESDRLGADG